MTRGTDVVEALARGLSISKDISFATCPAVSTGQRCLSVRQFSIGDEFTLLAVISWIVLPQVKFEALPMRREEPAENLAPSSGDGGWAPRVKVSPAQTHGLQGDPHTIVLL